MSESLHASSEQLIASEGPRGSTLGIAFSASLLFHLSVVALIFFKQPNPHPQEVPPAKVAMVVSLSGTNPQVKQQVVAESSEINAEDPAVDSSIEQQEETVVSAEATDTQQTATLEQPQVDQTIQNGAATATPASELAGEEAVENSGVPAITPSDLNNSVTAFIGTYKSSLTSNWLSECIRYQNEHGVKSCPPGEEGKSETSKAVNEATDNLFKTYVTRDTDNARVSRQLLAEMDALRVHMEDDSIMGELSRERYQVALIKYCTLNTCREASTITSAGFVSPFATPVSNEGGITILSIGDGATISGSTSAPLLNEAINQILSAGD